MRCGASNMHAYTHTQSTFTCATDIHVSTDHTHTLTHHESGLRRLEDVSPSAQAFFEPPSNTSRDPAISSPDVLDELDAAWVLSQAHAVVPDVFAKAKSKTSHRNRRRSSEHSDSPSAPAYVKTRVSSGTAFDASQVWPPPPHTHAHTHTHSRRHPVYGRSDQNPTFCRSCDREEHSIEREPCKALSGLPPFRVDCL